MNGESDWAMEEFQDVKFGDKRLDRRLVRVVSSLSNMPKQSIPAATEGWAETQGAYRMFDNEKVTLERILESHAERTMRRVGFLLHPSIVVTPDGLHLGTVDVNIWARDEKLGKSEDRKRRDFEEKESRRWRDGYGVSRDVAEACPDTTVINVGDRESDICEYLAEATDQRPENSRFVVRASQDRCLTELDEGQCRALLDVVHGRVVANTEPDDAKPRVPRLALRGAVDGGGMEGGLADSQTRAAARRSAEPGRDGQDHLIARCSLGPQVRRPAGPEIALDRPATRLRLRTRLDHLRARS